jgi:hypothetical protein
MLIHATKFPFIQKSTCSQLRITESKHFKNGNEKQDTIRNNWNVDEAAAGEFAVEFIVLHPLNIVRPLAIDSESRAKQ